MQTLMWVVTDGKSSRLFNLPEGAWVVEATDVNGQWYRAVFSGADGERRACQYAAWMDQQAGKNIEAGNPRGIYDARRIDG